ncbi:MAG: hypothetical protein SFW65_07020 [Alphaproteobacteria bacterium]|nr:hypothetical protein [Alphaproteobacteria bacterium]
MKKGGKGGANTKSGLIFEKAIDFKTILIGTNGYAVRPVKGKAGTGIFYHDKLVAFNYAKNDFYKFLKERNVVWEDKISKRLLPDDALLVIIRDTLFIIEVKTQTVEGSVDEKLQTCDFKRKQYQKLVADLELKVEYVYVLNSWFKKPKYKDVLDYISSVNCHYVFEKIPLKWLGLPT